MITGGKILIMIEDKRIAAVIVAAGKGLRMGGTKPKQYLELAGSTVLGHTLVAFESSCVDDVVIVCPDSDEGYVSHNIVSGRYKKVRAVVGGGRERFDSCAEGIYAAVSLPGALRAPDYVLIHDGVRALVTPDLIDRVAHALLEYPAVCPGVPVKDTVRRVDENDVATESCDRRTLRLIQTPQGFRTDMILEAYRYFGEDRNRDPEAAKDITDDAMLVEKYLKRQVLVTEGSYENIKITTPEDLFLAEAILAKRR